MKRALFFFALTITASICPVDNAYAKEQLSATVKSEIFALVVPTPTTAFIKENCFLREKPSNLSGALCEIKKNSKVEVLQDISEKWYRVDSEDADAEGWLHEKYLDITEEPALNLREMTKGELETFVNIMDFPTASGYLIWTDIARQKTYVFNKTDVYSLVRTLECSTGKSRSPTTRGFFTLKGRGEWFYSNRFKSGGMYWVRFNGAYLFHSVPMNRNKEITDEILGERRSSGCVRLALPDAEWLYENIPDGTSVFVY